MESQRRGLSSLMNNDTPAPQKRQVVGDYSGETDIL
jgi:hypothetical protein